MRTLIVDIVRAIRPYDPLEQEHVTTTITWLESGAPFCRVAKPATPPQHLVSYFVLVDPAADSLLLVDHKKAGLWLPSGGHVEPDEHPDATVRRELWEELQLPAHFLFPQPIFLTVTQTVGITAGHTDVSLWYVLRGDSHQTLHDDRDEFHQLAWFRIDALPLERTDPHMERFATKLRHYLTICGEGIPRYCWRTSDRSRSGLLGRSMACLFGYDGANIAAAGCRLSMHKDGQS